MGHATSAGCPAGRSASTPSGATIRLVCTASLFMAPSYRRMHGSSMGCFARSFAFLAVFSAPRGQRGCVWGRFATVSSLRGQRRPIWGKRKPFTGRKAPLAEHGREEVARFLKGERLDLRNSRSEGYKLQASFASCCRSSPYSPYLTADGSRRRSFSPY